MLFVIPVMGNNSSISVNMNDSDKHVNFQEINSILYIDISELSNLFSNEAENEGSQIVLEMESLKFASGSFFVVYDNKIKLRVAQMSLPCIEKNGRLLIPWLSFLNSMQLIGLMNYNSIDDKYNIVTDVFKRKSILKNEKHVIDKPKILAKDTIFNNNSKSDIPDYKSTNKAKNTKVISEISDSVSSPTKYIIPKGLVK